MAGNRVGSDTMKTVCIVQSRMGSTRLKGKALLPLAGKSLTQNLLERVKRATKLDAVVLAVPATPENECLWQVAHDAGCEFYWYKGDENDLVGRYLACAKSFDADIIVRVPGDNPCVEPEYIDSAIDNFFQRPYLFYSNTMVHLQLKPSIPYRTKWVDGLGCEIFTLSRLQWIDKMTLGNLKFREHPHLYWENFVKGCDCDNQEFAIAVADSPPRIIIPLRLDVNTLADYEFIREIYDHFGHNRFTIEEVLEYLDQKEAVHG